MTIEQFIVSTIIPDLILWILIIVGDSFVFTMFHKKLVGDWWWKKPKKYSFNISDSGWKIEGTQNPMETISSIINDLMGGDKNNG